MSASRPTRRLVLVVDDDRALRLIAAETLRDEGYEVRVAEHGGTALALLRAWRPDLILLDLMMPEVDGWSFRHAQLANPDLATIPVVLLSATFTTAPGTIALRAAAVLPKPYDLDQLVILVAQLIGRPA